MFAIVSKTLARFSAAKKTVTFTTNPAQKAAYITLSNNEKRNTLSWDTLSLLKSVLADVQRHVDSKQIKSLFIQHEGGVFSSGHDLRELNGDKAEEIFNLSASIFTSFSKMSIPVVSVVNGVAAAAGVQLLASTDLAIATEKSSFSTPGVKWGVFCTTPGVALIRSMSSEKKALEMLLLGEPISALEAERYGLINKVVKEEELKSAVDTYAEGFNKLSGQILSLGKKAYHLQKSAGDDIQGAYKHGIAAMCQNLKLEDSQEGLKAFKEKRKPTYKN